MVKRKLFWMMILAYCLFSIATFVSMTGLRTIASDPKATLTLSHNPYSPFVAKGYAVQNHHGDWIVTGSENVENTTIVLDGNLIIEESGSLTLRNVTLLFEQKPQDMYKLMAKPGSSLNISKSIIVSSQTDYRFLFIVDGANFVIKNSKLEGLGRPSEFGYNPGGGLLIYNTDGAILEDNTINHHESYGISITNSNNIILKNNTITCTGPDETSGAINLDNSHNNTITYNHLYRQWDAIHLQSSWNNYIAYNELTLTNHTIGISVWYGSGNNIIEYNNISAHEGYNIV
jgi:parallel beta-helix repeat protein